MLKIKNLSKSYSKKESTNNVLKNHLPKGLRRQYLIK